MQTFGAEGDDFSMKSFRQKELIDILEKNHVINTAEMAEHFNVSIETIRRDLDQLEKQGVLKKTYGGAELRMKPQVWPAPLKKRREISHESKAALAARVIEYIPDGCTIALDAGTTIFELCKHLCKKKNLIIISGDIHSAGELLSGGNNKVYMMGGFLTPDGTSSGTFAKEFFNNIGGIDIFLCSTDGAHPEDGLSTDEAGINELKKRYLKRAKTNIAIIDHSKFMKKAFYKMCDFSELDLVITDSKTPPEIIQTLRRANVEVDIVDV